MALRPQHVTSELLHKVTKALGITALDQWYYVSHHAAKQVIGSRVLNEFGGSLSSFLNYAYPQHHFDAEKLASTRNIEKDQKFVEVIIRQLFPNTEIHTKARKEVGIINPETEAYLEIDFWIPSLKLGIEYQDKHHFEYQWYANDSLEDYQKRDGIKKASMSAFGYTLITIGYWWDKSIESLAATIRKHRQDLLPHYERISALPIPSDPPLSYATTVIPGVAGLMSPFIPGYKFDPTNWYGGEKYDGIRGVYSPVLHKMFSRSGNELSVLPSLLNDIPRILVEGEIVAGRGNYNKTAAVSNHTLHDKVNWSIYRYMLFDVPDCETKNYTERYSNITASLSTRPFIFSQSVFRVLLANTDHLKTLLEAIINDFGEGVIAQRDSRYEYGRAKGLAKIKVRRDADAKVLHINKWSCACLLPGGITANIAYYNEFDPSDLKVGDIVSYYHNGYSQSGMPKLGEIYKVRDDLTWGQIESDNAGDALLRRSVKEAIGSKSLTARNIGRHKAGYWGKAENVRAFFDRFAEQSKFEPLVPENWYSVRVGTLHAAGGSGVLGTFSYNVKKALSFAYPELKFEEDKFVIYQKPRGHWHNPLHVRAFFDDFARISSFDPLVPENWYPVTVSTLRNAGGSGLFSAQRSLITALSFAYPELMFNKENFEIYDIKGRWNKRPNVRAFFDEFARRAAFDPLVVDNWYSRRVTVLHNSGGSGILNAFSYNLNNALSFAYPELMFNKEKFEAAQKPRGYWNERVNVRAFFDEFARTSGFDSLIPDNWKAVTTRALRSAGGSGILSAHGNYIKNALSFAYPEPEFDKGDFRKHEKATKGHWNECSNVRAFFDEFARKAGFDPLVPENWSSVTQRSLYGAGGGGLLSAHNNNLKSALQFGCPELKLDKLTTRGHWTKLPNVRAYLDEFARSAGFNPLVPENWYSVRAQALQQAGGGGMLSAFGYKIRTALSVAYPELKLEEGNFRLKSRGTNSSM